MRVPTCFPRAQVVSVSNETEAMRYLNALLRNLGAGS